jgi:hypothetical protein
MLEHYAESVCEALSLAAAQAAFALSKASGASE